jgi:hypothetical protein
MAALDVLRDDERLHVLAVYRPIHTASATMTATAAMKTISSLVVMRHMVRRRLIRLRLRLPPDLFHQRRRSSTIKAATRRKTWLRGFDAPRLFANF